MPAVPADSGFHGKRARSGAGGFFQSARHGHRQNLRIRLFRSGTDRHQMKPVTHPVGSMNAARLARVQPDAESVRLIGLLRIEGRRMLPAGDSHGEAQSPGVPCGAEFDGRRRGIQQFSRPEQPAGFRQIEQRAARARQPVQTRNGQSELKCQDRGNQHEEFQTVAGEESTFSGRDLPGRRDVTSRLIRNISGGNRWNASGTEGSAIAGAEGLRYLPPRF